MLKRKMLYAATMALVLSTSGCSDLVDRVKGWCGCFSVEESSANEKKNREVKKEKKSKKRSKKQKKNSKPAKKSVHMGGVTVSPNPELSAEDFFVKTVTAEDVRHGLETSDKLVVIDTAAKKVYEDCHIIGAINIPLEDLNEGVEGIGRDTPIILYCATNKCPRSTKAAQLLKQRGYVDVAVYQGGMRDWYNLQHPYDGPADRPYLKSKAK